MFYGQPEKVRKGRIKGSDVDLMGCDFAVDTAMSWDGNFPKPGKGDYLVTLGDVHKGNAQVLVSRRYLAAPAPEDAADIALDAFSEQQGYKKNDKGNILEITISGFGTGVPCWVEKIEAVY
jgi:hypothetical protein